MLEFIPKQVHVLPQACKKSNKTRLSELLKFAISKDGIKYVFKFVTNRKECSSIKTQFVVDKLSLKNDNHYDYAIGFLEYWSDRYLTYNVNADKKYAWLHSTFANITSYPEGEFLWMRKVDKIVFVTDACKQAFVEDYPEFKDKTIVVENILDGNLVQSRSKLEDLVDDNYLKFKEEKLFKIITVCRIDINTKGLDRIVNCVKELKSKGYKFKWCIVGDGKDYNQLEYMIKNANVGDYIMLVGNKLNPYPYIKQADVMVMPSRYEGKPMSITEAQILGVPPIVTEYLSAKQQIKNGVDGIVLNNVYDSFLNGMINLLSNVNIVGDMKSVLKVSNFENTGYIKSIEKELFE